MMLGKMIFNDLVPGQSPKSLMRKEALQAEPAGQCVPGRSRGDEGRGDASILRQVHSRRDASNPYAEFTSAVRIL
jgi:hypothetical protein